MFVSALVNVALLKPATQSSIKLARGPSLAVDGNKDPSAEAGGSCSAMEKSLHPWWRVDLGSTFQMKEVSISQRDSNRKLRYVFTTYVLIPPIRNMFSTMSNFTNKTVCWCLHNHLGECFRGTLPKKTCVYLQN